MRLALRIRTRSSHNRTLRRPAARCDRPFFLANPQLALSRIWHEPWPLRPACPFDAARQNDAATADRSAPRSSRVGLTAPADGPFTIGVEPVFCARRGVDRRVARARARRRRRRQARHAAPALRVVGDSADAGDNQTDRYSALISAWTTSFRTSATRSVCACGRRASPRSPCSRWRSASAPTRRSSRSSTRCCSSRCRSAIPAGSS